MSLNCKQMSTNKKTTTRSGQSWKSEEDKQLLEEAFNKTSILELVKIHERTDLAIRGRICSHATHMIHNHHLSIQDVIERVNISIDELNEYKIKQKNDLPSTITKYSLTFYDSIHKQKTPSSNPCDNKQEANNITNIKEVSNSDNISGIRIHDNIGITDLIGHRVLVFDLETTGKPEKPEKLGLFAYYDPSQVKKYTESRIVQVAFYYSESYRPEFDQNQIKCSIIKQKITRIDFEKYMEKIPKERRHGITYDDACEKGRSFVVVMNDGFRSALFECEYIVGHNVLFDVNVLLSELYRLPKPPSVIKKIKKKPIVDTMKIGEGICRLPFDGKYKSYKKYKFPQLSELYECVCHKSAKNLHDAKIDVSVTLECMKMIQLRENKELQQQENPQHIEKIIDREALLKNNEKFADKISKANETDEMKLEVFNLPEQVQFYNSVMSALNEWGFMGDKNDRNILEICQEPEHYFVDFFEKMVEQLDHDSKYDSEDTYRWSEMMLLKNDIRTAWSKRFPKYQFDENDDDD